MGKLKVILSTTSGGGSVAGVQSVTGDGVGGTPENVVMSFPDQSEIQTIRPLKTVNNESLEGTGNITIDAGGAVNSVTGDGVGGTAEDVVLSFPNADEVDDSSTTNKFLTQTEKDKITQNETFIALLQTNKADKSDLDNLNFRVTQNETDINNISSNVSGVNTGDETTESIKLKRPLKTINGEDLNGAGNLVITGDAINIDSSVESENKLNPVSGNAVFNHTEFNSSCEYGVNLVNNESVNFNNDFVLNVIGGLNSNPNGFAVTDYIKVKENTTYTTNYKRYVSFYDSQRNEISTLTSRPDLYFTTPLGTEYLRFDGNIKLYMVEGQFITFPSDVEEFRYIIDEKQSAKQYVKNLHEDVYDGINQDRENALNPFALNIDSLNNQIDELTDKENPYFIDNTEFFKGAYKKTNSSGLITSVTKIDENNFTVSDSDADLLTDVGQGVTVSGGDFENYTVLVTQKTSLNGITTFTVKEDLPSNLESVCSIGEGGNGQHLSGLGQKAYAEYVADQLTKYNYKKDTVLVDFNPSYCDNNGFSDERAWNLDRTEVLFNFQRIGNALSGGFVEGTTDLSRNLGANDNLSFAITPPYSRSLTAAYLVKQGVSGQGVELSTDMLGYSGFVKVCIGCISEEYTPTGGGAAFTSGSVIVDVYSDETLLKTETISPYSYKEINVDFKFSKNITIKTYCENSTPTVYTISSLQIYLKNPNQLDVPIISSDDVIAVFADSWGVFPLIDNSDPSPLRPDGTELGGRGYMSSHMVDYLANKGVNIQSPNMSKGGQTSEWAKYWVKSIKELTPKPTHCILHFSINDNNSSDEYTNQLPSVYDFDPNNQWLNLSSDNGGVFGSVNSFLWYDNMRFISDYLLSNGIKPIILTPPLTSSESQAFNITKYFKSMIYSGFKDNYRLNGGQPNAPTI